MSWWTRRFSGAQGPPSLEEIVGLLRERAAQQFLRDSATRLCARFGNDYLRDAANHGQGVTHHFIEGLDGFGASLDVGDLRRLLRQGLPAFVAEIARNDEKLERRLKALIDRDRHACAEHLLLISVDKVPTWIRATTTRVGELSAGSRHFLGTYLRAELQRAAEGHEDRSVREAAKAALEQVEA